MVGGIETSLFIISTDIFCLFYVLICLIVFIMSLMLIFNSPLGYATCALDSSRHPCCSLICIVESGVSQSQLYFLK